MACVLLFDLPVAKLFTIKKRVSVSRHLFDQKRLHIVGKKKSWLEKHKENVLFAIQAGGSKLTWEKYIRLVAAFAIAGALFGALFENLLLSIAMTACFPCIPIQYLRLKGTSYKRYLHMQVENVLGIITNTYMQSEDILSAIVSNLSNQSNPLKEILSDFEMEIYVGNNTVTAIRHMRSKVDNRYFHEWCDRLIQCQSDRSLKVLLPPITEMLSDMRQIQAELDTAMMAVWRDHITISLVVGGSIPLMRMINADWYQYLTTTTLGKIIVCLTFVTIFVSTLYVMRVNKPVNMEA